MFVIVGLGNPGREYSRTRHNVGFMTIDRIAERLNISVNKKGFRSVYGEGRLGGTRVVLAKPETFMNNSGWAVGDLLKWYKPQHDELVVIYDDIDLPCAEIFTHGSQIFLSKFCLFFLFFFCKTDTLRFMCQSIDSVYLHIIHHNNFLLEKFFYIINQEKLFFFVSSK